MLDGTVGVVPGGALQGQNVQLEGLGGRQVVHNTSLVSYACHSFSSVSKQTDKLLMADLSFCHCFHVHITINSFSSAENVFIVRNEGRMC